MTGQCGNRIACADTVDQLYEPAVLNVLERQIIAPLKLDANGKIIAARSALPARNARVPGTLITGDKLKDLSVATDQKMCRNMQGMNL